MELYFNKLGSKGPALIIMHGVFGSADNWITLGRRFAENFTVYLVDLRNHGKSPHHHEHNYEVMAEDVNQLIKKLNVSEAYLIGHSMGGKVAMKMAVENDNLIKKMVIVDIGPKHYPPHHQQVLEGFRSVNLAKVDKRQDAEKMMSEKISHPAIRLFLLKNLQRNDDGSFSWKLNLDVIEEQIEEIGKGLEENEKSLLPVLFIRGANSDYISKEDEGLISNHFPNAKLTSIKAGHWVHAEQPDALFEEVLNFFDDAG